MLGGFLQCFQQAVEGRLGQHMNLVNDVDLEARADSGVAHSLYNLTNIVNAGVAGRVHLDHVDMATFGNGGTRFTLAARIYRGATLPVRSDAIQGLGDKPRGGGFANPAHARHQKGMRQPVTLYGICQRAHHRFLPDQLTEGLRTVFAREYSIRLAGGIGDCALCARCRFGRGFCPRFRRRWRRAEHRILSGCLKFGGGGLALLHLRIVCPWRAVRLFRGITHAGKGRRMPSECHRHIMSGI